VAGVERVGGTLEFCPYSLTSSIHLRIFVFPNAKPKGESCDALYAVLNGRLRESVASQYGYHGNRRAPSGTSMASSSAPPQQEGGSLSTDSTSFLSRARRRLKYRVMERINKNKPEVANQPHPPSRRMMNAAGEELQGEGFGKGAILGEVEVLTGAWCVSLTGSVQQ
jgi:hypothetical protein